MTAEQRRAHMALCIHEASHSVVGVALGAQLRRAVVTGATKTGPARGLTSFIPDDHPAWNDPLIALAGPWGEAHFNAGGRRPTQRELFALLDRGGVNCDRDQLSLVGGLHAGLEAVPHAERCWPAIVATAKKLYADGEVHHRDITAALGLDPGDHGGPTSVGLAAIRAGARAVTPRAPTPA